METRFATSIIASNRREEFAAYLYSHTTIVTQAHALDGPDREYIAIVTKTEVAKGDVEYLQQYQCDRLASGMFGQVIGFASYDDAVAYIRKAATDNQWTLFAFTV